MRAREKKQLKEIYDLVANALGCLTADPPRRGAADYLLSAREAIGEMIIEPIKEG